MTDSTNTDFRQPRRRGETEADCAERNVLLTRQENEAFEAFDLRKRDQRRIAEAELTNMGGVMDALFGGRK